MSLITLQVDTSRATAAFSRMREAVAAGTGTPAIKAGVEDGVNVYMGFIRRRFSEASNSPGAPWADLAPVTKYNRLRRAGVRFPRRKGTNRLASVASIQLPILYDSGALYTSLVPGEPGYVEQWEENGVTAGTVDPKARFHQDGTSRMPARPILVAPDSDSLESIRRSEAAGIRTALTEAAGGT